VTWCTLHDDRNGMARNRGRGTGGDSGIALWMAVAFDANPTFASAVKGRWFTVGVNPARDLVRSAR
ncbi:MAG TPA: hypothetical protein VHU83_19205, partial [Bryobacteraceae bacterium]|nr:hypothetical protein [Bryobacteraceae bacterium]